MKFALILSLLVSPASAQFMQSIPPKSDSNCEQRADIMYKWLQDWPNLARYEQADETMTRTSDPQRVIFMGDSITDGWDLAKWFPGKPYVNRGIGGQTTPQMLLRFQQDVIELHPSAVVILAGTNDIAGNTGPMTLEQTENNFAAMVAIAQAHRIGVVIQSVMPVNDYTEQSKRFFAERPMDKIRTLNGWLKDFAKRENLVYVDYFTPMVDEHGLLRRDLANDGLHPNDTGYAMMVKLLQPAIDSVLPASSTKR
jgi:lysophospholipase L1-like esterase